jgi:hypothetical protein
VSTELHSAVTLQFTADRRLAAAAGGVVRYFADAAGMDAESVAKLQAAALTICLSAIAHSSNAESILSVEVSRFADRIEVAVARPGTAVKSAVAPPGVDRITQELQNGTPVVRLTKFL